MNFTLIQRKFFFGIGTTVLILICTVILVICVTTIKRKPYQSMTVNQEIFTPTSVQFITTKLPAFLSLSSSITPSTVRTTTSRKNFPVTTVNLQTTESVTSTFFSTGSTTMTTMTTMTTTSTTNTDENTVCTHDLQGSDYRGMRTKTKSGRICQRWDQHLPFFLENYRDANFPNDASIHAAENYCRTPISNYAMPDRPWCYTTDPDVIFETCSIPMCSKPLSFPDCRRCQITIVNKTCISCDMNNCSLSCVCMDRKENMTRSVIKLETDTGRRCNPMKNDSTFQCYDYPHVKIICPDTSIDMRYAESIKLSDIIEHIRALDHIANTEKGTRAVRTKGFNRTLDYISDYLSANTNYNVTKTFFHLRNSEPTDRSTLFTLSNGIVKEHTDFYYVKYSKLASFANYMPLTVIRNLGCSDSDWSAAKPSTIGRVALVKRGVCTFDEKALLSMKYNVSGLLIYNDGTSPDRFAPISISLSQSTTVPALFLSYTLGQLLVDEAKNLSSNISVRITISLVNDATTAVGNICADTPTGDPTKTIVIGSHSDSVMTGPGINDNGSGSAANLALAVALARLFQTGDYPLFKYRIRFCWWGAEELGLLGSAHHVTQAKLSSVIGERITDYLININFDMLGSPNFIFGIYNGKTAKTNTPSAAIPGSTKVTTLFRDWFIQENLPWDYTSFDGRSDYGPFLAAGVAAGGLFSGADAIKTKDQHERYERILGNGLGGTAYITQDRCYHMECDSIHNINTFCLETMVKAGASAIESMARQDDLKSWLYPPKDIKQMGRRIQRRYEYNSVNEYFELPYL